MTPPKIEASLAAFTSMKVEALSVDFDLTAAKGDGAPKLPTFEIVGYTGAPISLSGFFSPVIVDLAGLRTASQEIPVLRDHDTSRIVGQTTAVKIAGDVRLSGRVTGENDDAREVLSQAKNGFKWQASIGASVDRREFLDAGKTATINGRTVNGPMVLVREATLGEISFVAIGADSATSATVAASQSLGSHQGQKSMFDSWLQAKGFDPTALSDPQKTSLKALFDAEQAQAAANAAAAAASASANGTLSPAVASLDQLLKAHRDEDDRVAAITRITADAIQRRPAMIDRLEDVSRHAIAAKSTVAEYELAVLRLMRDAPATSGVHVRSGERATTQDVIEATLCREGRLSSLDKHFDARTLEASDRHFRHGIGLRELLLIGARENGHHTVSDRDVRGLLRGAFDIRADGFSNINIPNTLANVMNKFLVDYFMSVESAWRDVCAIRPVKDFKQVSSVSLTGDLQYEEVGATGELKSGSLGEQQYTNQAKTYGKILAITRQDIINDDLGALMRVPQRLGRGGALKMNDVIWTVFLAGVGTFWTSGRANLISGGTTNLQASSLTTALSTFRKQTDPDGKPLGLTPAVLLVPPEVEQTAKQLMNSAFFVAGGSATTAQIPSTNTWQGAYKVAVSTYLSNTSYTGYSTTAWFLLASPMDLPTIELAVLNGREMPIIESAEAEFDTLGIQVRGYHDFGASLQEYRGSVRSAGT